MLPVNRRVLCSTVLALSGFRAFPASAAAESATRMYVGNSARLTAAIPADWKVGQTRVGAIYAFDYQGADGFVACFPVSGPTLEEACASLTASPHFADHPSTVVATTWSGQPAARVDGQINDASASALVVPHPDPFDLFGDRMAFAVLIADPDHFEDIVQTLSFSPERITPEAYVTSVLELVEARAWWSGDVDWALAREVARLQIEGLTEVSLTQGAIADIVQHLRGVGDNHSRYLSPMQSADKGEASGVGFLIGGKRVVLVFPDGPADRAGVRVGDLLEAVDGTPFIPSPEVGDASWMFGITAELTLRRPGVLNAFTVAVEQGQYSQYVAPSGRRLPDDLGYIEIPQVLAPGRNADYVSAARSVIVAVDQSPTLGWVVDLRLNQGGSYSPMIAGLGPILGDGVFGGWRSTDDQQSWVTYDEGLVSDNGQQVASYADQPGAVLQHPNPPVAVLVGPMTASSGEVTTLAFVERPNARLFGEQTGGYTTANAGYPLYDGSALALAEAAMMDRNGVTHMEGVEPDEIIPTEWETYGTDDDPVLRAAMEWLYQQSSSSEATPTPELIAVGTVR